MTEYVPDRGDFVWMTFDPQLGREQAGRRPALVLSTRSYNERTGLAVVCPLTKRRKGYPFEVGVFLGSLGDGVVLVDQVKSVDWRRRQPEWITRCSPDVLAGVVERLATLIGF